MPRNLDTKGQLRAAIGEGSSRGRDQYVAKLRRAQILDLVHYRSVLETLALEPTSFLAAYKLSRNELIERLDTEYEGLKGDEELAEVRGRLGFVLLTARLLEATYSSIRGEVVDLEKERSLLRDKAISAVLKDLYVPLSNDSPQSKDLWSEIAFDHLDLHRVGTTSFIVRCRAPGLRNQADLALKCLLYPYTQIEVIVDSTRNYARDYTEGASPAIVSVLASASSWILMEFIDGRTLSEVIDERRKLAKGSEPVDIEFLSRVGPPLVRALHTLNIRRPSTGGEDNRHLNQHLDLTPSNIMVSDEMGREPDIKLIDLGRNHLFTRKLGLADGVDGVFVAPEVKDDHPDAMSDVYSLGLILSVVADPSSQPGRTSNHLWEFVPELARFLDEMIDTNPEYRVPYLRREVSKGHGQKGKSKTLYEHLLDLLKYEIELIEKIIDYQPYSTRGKITASISLLRPNSGQVKERKTLRDYARAHPHPVGKRNTEWLFGWSFVAISTWYVAFALMFIYGTRAIGLDLYPNSISILGWLAHNDNAPFVLDNLRAENYDLNHIGVNWPGYVICFALGATAVKYYQTVLAGLTTRGTNAPGWLITEVGLRVVSFATFPSILACILIQPQWWIWAAFGGGVVITFTNYFVYDFAIRSVRTAARFSTTPSEDDPLLKSYGQWWTSQFVYTGLLLAAAVGIRTGAFKDVGVYAAEIATITLGVQYILKCTLYADPMRGILHRSFMAGERWRAMERGLDSNGMQTSRLPSSDARDAD